ncbi:MAG: energy-coupling factor transporter transmembrane component T family protein [Lachnospiraceae bacterium]|jgi:energy-coupling factor transport system permease protein
MLKDITLGQYYPADSIIHRLDSRVKFVGTVVYIASLFVVHGIPGYLLAALGLIAMISLSKVPFKFMVKGMKAVLVVLIVMLLFNIFLTPGTILWSWGILKITKEGLCMAAKMLLRLTFLVIGTSVMTLTTTPNQLTDGLEKLFGPLKVIHLPVHEIAMMMSIALRFIPILTEETDKIMKAQMARGADFSSGNIIKRAKSMVPLLVPLFISAFRRANDLALAMESRCYHGGEGRTSMRPLVYKKRDYAAYIIIAAFLAAAICIRIFYTYQDFLF